jgi:isocitrate/isopropylmalate dehydrogenase
MLRLANLSTTANENIVALGGDGVGPEVVGATVRVLRVLEPDIPISEPLHGKEAVSQGLEALPAETRQEIDQSGAVLFGAVDTENGHAVSLLRYLRFHSDCFANVRPVRPLQGVAHRLGSATTNIVVVRELTEGMYPGREGTLEEWSGKLSGFKDRLGRALPTEGWMSIRVTTAPAVQRIAHYAAKLALLRKEEGFRGKITIVTKRNVLRESDGMFADLSRQTIAEVSSDIDVEEQYIDDACRRLVSNTDDFDVVLLPNLFGDIFSDIATEVMGGMGLAPSAALGATISYFEGCHGSAPDIAGRGLANPTATMLSAAMMLNFLGKPRSASRLTKAIEACFEAGHFTADLGGNLSTEAFTERVMEHV